MADLSIEDLLRYLNSEKPEEPIEFRKVLGSTKYNRKETGLYGSPYYVQGQEYYMPVSISFPVDVTVSSSNAYLGVISSPPSQEIQDWLLPNAVISIKNEKKIVETELTERRGTVKEIINMNDYQITIKGVVVNTANEFPEYEVVILRNLYEQNVPLSIKCPLTDIFLLRPDRSGSDKVVIKSLDFPENPGVKHVRPYTLELVSDEPFNLIDIS